VWPERWPAAVSAARKPRTAAVAAFAPQEIRGSAFGLLATVQAIGNIAACAIAGLLYAVTSPMVAFAYLAVWMLIAPAMLTWAARLASDRLLAECCPDDGQ
jgi:MFS family permease